MMKENLFARTNSPDLRLWRCIMTGFKKIYQPQMFWNCCNNHKSESTISCQLAIVTHRVVCAPSTDTAGRSLARHYRLGGCPDSMLLPFDGMSALSTQWEATRGKLGRLHRHKLQSAVILRLPGWTEPFKPWLVNSIVLVGYDQIRFDV